MVHDRTVNGTACKLGVSGKVRNGNLVMYDQETGSLWLQETGQALEGKMKGKALSELPADEYTHRIRWDEWKKLHPDTLVLDCGHCR